MNEELKEKIRRNIFITQPSMEEAEVVWLETQKDIEDLITQEKQALLERIEGEMERQDIEFHGITLSRLQELLADEKSKL